jgi:hypothetical protein
MVGWEQEVAVLSVYRQGKTNFRGSMDSEFQLEILVKPLPTTTVVGRASLIANCKKSPPTHDATKTNECEWMED